MSAFEFSLPASLRLPLRLGVGAYSLLIIWASLRPAGTGGAIPHMDKLLHFLVYAVLAFGVGLAWSHWPKLRVFWSCALFGAMLEIGQGLFGSGRTASVWDALANSLGAAIGALAVIWLGKLLAR